jgi:hypothetical protein
MTAANATNPPIEAYMSHPSACTQAASPQDHVIGRPRIPTCWMKTPPVKRSARTHHQGGTQDVNSLRTTSRLGTSPKTHLH